MNRNLVMGMCLAGVIAIGAICCGCGGSDCNISQMKTCETSSDCVVVGCGCCYDANNEAVRKECEDTWYRIKKCDPGDVICLQIVCYRNVVCENNQCVVK